VSRRLHLAYTLGSHILSLSLDDVPPSLRYGAP
jgi:hypothetical protein